VCMVVGPGRRGPALPAGRAAPSLTRQHQRFARQEAPYDADTEL